MKSVVQRVRDASVTVDGIKTGSISRGLLVYLGVAGTDTEKDADWMAEKIVNLRIFEDAGGKMNLSIKDIIKDCIIGQDEKREGPAGVLTISQFTLLGDASKGRRPYYGDAAGPDKARLLYEYFMKKVREQGLICESGVFQAHMDVQYINAGPVTILLDSP
jgi:D-tyrosyl-tRNA(Tyr) deacylase